MIHTFGMEGTKWSIFEQSVSLFATKGFHSVSMKDIARSVKIKPSSIYNHFLSKEEILTTAYDYYDHYFYRDHPLLESLLEEVETVAPKDILMKLINVPGEPDMDTFMHKIFITASLQMYDDYRARELIVNKMFVLPREYFIPLFSKMMALKKIQPFDIESYLLIHSSLCHSTTLMTASKHTLSWDKWIQCHKFLFDSIIKEA